MHALHCTIFSCRRKMHAMPLQQTTTSHNRCAEVWLTREATGTRGQHGTLETYFVTTMARYWGWGSRLGQVALTSLGESSGPGSSHFTAASQNGLTRNRELRPWRSFASVGQNLTVAYGQSGPPTKIITTWFGVSSSALMKRLRTQAGWSCTMNPTAVISDIRPAKSICFGDQASLMCRG